MRLLQSHSWREFVHIGEGAVKRLEKRSVRETWVDLAAETGGGASSR